MLLLHLEKTAITSDMQVLQHNVHLSTSNYTTKGKKNSFNAAISAFHSELFKWFHVTVIEHCSLHTFTSHLFKIAAAQEEKLSCVFLIGFSSYQTQFSRAHLSLFITVFKVIKLGIILIINTLQILRRKQDFNIANTPV